LRAEALDAFVIALVLAAAAALSSPIPEARPGGSTPAVQATATVRIVPGARVTATEIPEEAVVRDAKVTGPDGVQRPARLVEFP
jgi:hypothetical protein